MGKRQELVSCLAWSTRDLGYLLLADRVGIAGEPGRRRLGDRTVYWMWGGISATWYQLLGNQAVRVGLVCCIHGVHDAEIECRVKLRIHEHAQRTKKALSIPRPTLSTPPTTTTGDDTHRLQLSVSATPALAHTSSAPAPRSRPPDRARRPSRQTH